MSKIPYINHSKALGGDISLFKFNDVNPIERGRKLRMLTFIVAAMWTLSLFIQNMTLCTKCCVITK